MESVQSDSCAIRAKNHCRLSYSRAKFLILICNVILSLIYKHRYILSVFSDAYTWYGLNKCALNVKKKEDWLGLDILTVVKWYLAMAWICVSLTTSDGGHLFMCLLLIYMLCWKNAYWGALPIFNCFFLKIWVIWVLCTFWVLTPYQTHHLQMSSPIQEVAFWFCWCPPLLCKTWNHKTPRREHRQNTLWHKA